MKISMSLNPRLERVACAQKSISLKTYFRIQHPAYKILRIIPPKSKKNTQIQQIGKLMAYTQQKISNSITKEEKCWVYTTKAKCSYYIDITKNDVGFYFILPELHLSIAKAKIYDTWPNAQIVDTPNLPNFTKDAVAYALNYDKEDAFSLSTDQRCNTLTHSILNVVDILNDTDHIGIYYNFLPTAQTSWETKYKTVMERYKADMIVKKNALNMNAISQFAAETILDIMQGIINGIIESMGGTTQRVNTQYKNRKKASSDIKVRLSYATKQKRDSYVIDSQLAVFSQSENKQQAINNAVTVCQSYTTLNEDNELKATKIAVPKQALTGFEYRIPNCPTLQMSVPEISTLMHLPTTNTLEQYNIKNNATTECPVATDLRKGYINLGKVKVREDLVDAYMSVDKNLANLGLVVLGPQGSGKTTFFGNYCINAAEESENVVCLDFIKNCELSEEIASHTDPSRLIELDLSKFEDMQSFGFNEAKYYGMDTPSERLDAAQIQSQLTIQFIDSINLEADFTRAMRRSLNAACNVVYIHPNTCLRDVILCLEDLETRKDYIERIPAELKNELHDAVNALNALDEYDKKGNLVGTKESKLEGILDRMDTLMEDRRLKGMFNKPIEGNIDFVQCLEEGKSILIKMPEFYFPSKYHKNILVTFFICKLWLAAQIRGKMHEKPLRTHVILDEIFQAPTCYKLLEDILLQARKFQVKFVFSAHFLNKLGSLKEVLKASGASYMFLQGTDKANFTEMEEDLDPFTLDTLLQLDRFYSMNYIRCDKGYSKFISKLPAPINTKPAWS